MCMTVDGVISNRIAALSLAFGLCVGLAAAKDESVGTPVKGVGVVRGRIPHWGFGPAWGAGIGIFRRRCELYAMAQALLWLGEDGDDFNAAGEGAVKVVLGARF